MAANNVLASRFFTNSPTQDEKVAMTPTDPEADFDAGIERSLKKRRKCIHIYISVWS
jgi:hypothetical protein